ncbi:hypothetical protein AOL_s00004g512 [Orbilia oligospora ATCC 24927]|uniref:Uncharacterized protein n=1 Tax=Arthrobotrys oligospora (strain ATCC 24927 / CBS 115.81 / DSM 1491) TaxID=756982 RepID=G1WZ01_ARTOA|nr:hypothetical protein AOL_s00004g512 [Orbilia oligospora ATCC 24927]EGX53853.1 hypothetical protein AOL_s00004g512 [Orbilia oligospora ATCC 24927]
MPTMAGNIIRSSFSTSCRFPLEDEAFEDDAFEDDALDDESLLFLGSRLLDLDEGDDEDGDRPVAIEIFGVENEILEPTDLDVRVNIPNTSIGQKKDTSSS